MNMPTVSVPINQDVKDHLEKEIKREGTNTSAFVSEAVQIHLDYIREDRRIDMERDKQAEKGEWISEDAMTAWFSSLGTENELPEPQVDVFLK